MEDSLYVIARGECEVLVDDDVAGTLEVCAALPPIPHPLEVCPRENLSAGVSSFLFNLARNSTSKPQNISQQIHQAFGKVFCIFFPLRVLYFFLQFSALLFLLFLQSFSCFFSSILDNAVNACL